MTEDTYRQTLAWPHKAKPTVAADFSRRPQQNGADTQVAEATPVDANSAFAIDHLTIEDGPTLTWNVIPGCDCWL